MHLSIDLSSESEMKFKEAINDVTELGPRLKANVITRQCRWSENQSRLTRTEIRDDDPCRK